LGDFNQNGTYKLSVQGSDKTGNLSGDLEYKVSFKIDHESKITQVLNYPNPFSSNTRFVFTLTGSEIPEIFRIKIFRFRLFVTCLNINSKIGISMMSH
jgi:hypothetical protein